MATVVLAGVLVNVLSPQAGRIIPPPAAQPASTASSARSSAAQPNRDPLTVVSEDPLNVDELYDWVFPKPLVLSSAKLKYLNGDEAPSNSIANYLYSLGGYETGEAETQLVVQNNQNVPVRVIDIGMIKSCTAPLDGTLVWAPGQASIPTVRLGFDLDKPYSVAVQIPDQDFPPDKPGIYDTAIPYFGDYTVSISPGTQQVFNLFAQAFKSACTFRYQLTILEGETKVTQIIGDGSTPFRVSALAPFPSYALMYAGGDCSPAPSGQFVKVNQQTYKIC